MSLLNKLGKVQQLNKIDAATARVAAPLFDPHPIVNEPEDFRLQYLAAVALGVAADREMTDNERLRWNGLARALGLDETEASDQFNGREDMSEQDIARIFKILNIKQLEWTYLLDVAWQQMADGPAAVQAKWPLEGSVVPEIKVIETVEEQTLKVMAELLSIKTSSDLRFLHDLALAVSSQDFTRAVWCARNLPERLDTTEIKNMFRFQRYEVVVLTVESDRNSLWRELQWYMDFQKEKLIEKGDILGGFEGKYISSIVIASHAGVVARQVKELRLVEDAGHDADWQVMRAARLFGGGSVPMVPEIGQIWGTLYRTEFDD